MSDYRIEGQTGDWEVVIGLEIHAQVISNAKLFSSAPTAFGAAANTQVSLVDAAMPGMLPVINGECVRQAVRTGLALGAEINLYSVFDRKNYFYPDLPKGYQISQFDLPFSYEGHLEVCAPKGAFNPRTVRITRVHLEEDAGKSMHDETAGTADSRIDLNRTGTPLCEIVTEPDLRSAEEARAWLNELKLLLVYLGVSDCNMQEGSLRVDANVNLHVPQKDGRIAKTPIVEIKNMNSFRSVERALIYETERQWGEWQATGAEIGSMPNQTRGWDESAGVTRGQRH
ncbi:MAG: Asp-tRNA(Asn)/Glu-tRNA(Gln) amidotransferase subunit GatB, partial [Rhodospirillaceae bacterium]|nr:Asp-tRNA(Asn)/Glu-tRNA(Gln) amidotransferase subunit GatB [Rhodospirillaceae bacterium]